jgi:hypothetical protein
MRTLSNLDLLDLWERGTVLHPLDRALLALAVAQTDQDCSTLADWPLGRRNAALVRLRRACFGQTLAGWVACPECGERLEFSIDAAKLDADSSRVTVRFDMDGRSFRPLTSRDLAAVAGEADEQAAALELLRRCCVDGGNFSTEEIDTISNQLAQADPMSETLLDLECAECGHRWDEPLDIATWLWTEIEARARRLLLDVHTLAAAYGWTEAEILSLSEPRRAIYMEMVQA